MGAQQRHRPGRAALPALTFMTPDVNLPTVVAAPEAASIGQTPDGALPIVIFDSRLARVHHVDGDGALVDDKSTQDPAQPTHLSGAFEAACAPCPAQQYRCWCTGLPRLRGHRPRLLLRPLRL
ncbi:hypothetical protein [Streptomyces sp. NPDC048419]|uniref:hypothetical protein n=1 Tax=Streptomyces sp. NPDC048419 TaxID=3365547 RepID=UPI003718D5A7